MDTVNKNNNDIYITLVGFNQFHGTKPFKINSLLKLVKDPNNQYDLEAIGVHMRYAGQVAYVANSTQTVVKGTMSGGRLYDKILDTDFAEVKFISNDSIIAKNKLHSRLNFHDFKKTFKSNELNDLKRIY